MAFMRTDIKTIVQLQEAVSAVTVDLGDRAAIVERIYGMLDKSKRPAAAQAEEVRETIEQKKMRVASGQLAGIQH